MRLFRYAPLPPPRSAVIVLLLLLALGVTATLTYQAQHAARSHRATAERTLRDYAGLAAFQFAGYASSSLRSSVWVELAQAERIALSASPLPHPAVLAKGRDERCKVCPSADSVEGYFRLDLRDGSFVSTRAAADARLYRWLADSLARFAPAESEPNRNGMVIAEVDGRPRIIGFVVRTDSTRRPLAAFGFEAEPEAYGTLLDSIVAEKALLPPSLAGKTASDSLLSVTLLDPAGRVLYRSSPDSPESFVAEDTVGALYGGMRVRVALRPSAAERLVIGGLPRSRLPLLLGMLALTAGLVGVALVQLRRHDELARLRSDFVAGVSHELRTPLAQIRMFAETLLLGRVRSEDERTRSLEIIDQEARRLTHLVENVLVFSRAERRYGLIHPVPTDLAAEIRSVAEGFLPVARGRRAEFRLQLQEGVVAPVDPAALRQLLLNLLDNAIKYGPVGQTVVIGLEWASGCARIRVEDEGMGVPVKDRGRIWEPYRRLGRDVESAVGGSGIGLAVVRELVALHGGRAWVEDAPAGGARFVLEVVQATVSLRDEEEAVSPDGAAA